MLDLSNEIFIIAKHREQIVKNYERRKAALDAAEIGLENVLSRWEGINDAVTRRPMVSVGREDRGSVSRLTVFASETPVFEIEASREGTFAVTCLNEHGMNMKREFHDIEMQGADSSVLVRTLQADRLEGQIDKQTVETEVQTALKHALKSVFKDCYDKGVLRP